MCMCSPDFFDVFGIDEKSKLLFKLKLPKLMQEWQEVVKKQERDRVNWNAECTVKNPDLVFYNGTIYTMEEDVTKVEAIAIIKDRILSVGDEKTIMKLIGPNTKVINLKGKTLLPGFIDPHVHMAFSSMKHWVQLSPFIHKDMDEVYNKIVSTVNAAK